MYPTMKRLLRTRSGKAEGLSAAVFEPLEARKLLAVDLVAAFVSSSPHSLVPNESFTSAVVVNNNGDDQSPGFSVQFRLSSDNIFGNSDDVVLGTGERPNGLAGDASTSIARTLTIPSGVQPGNYFLAFIVDPSGSVLESNEGNNIAFSDTALITVTEGGGGDVNLDVFGNGQEILDGEFLTSQTNHTFFGDAEIGQELDREFTLTNDGSGTLQILGVTFAGVNNVEFAVVGSSLAAIGPGQSVNLTVRFAPLAEGTRVGSIQIQTNDTNDGTGDPSIFTFAISGAGIGEGGATFPQIEISGNGAVIRNGDTSGSFADHTSFDALRVDNAAQTRTYTIRNTGDATLNISGIEVFDGDAEQFVVLDDIDSIAPGESATFRVRFDAASLGRKFARVRVLSNDADDSTYTFKLTGRGALNGGIGDGTPEIVVSGRGRAIADGDLTPTPSDRTGFNRVGENGRTRTHTFTIANTGTTSLDIDSISIIGRDADNFAVLDQPTDVAAGATATFRVRFDPDAVGERRADVRIVSNDSDEGEYTFRLRGYGVDNTLAPTGEIGVVGVLALADGDTAARGYKGTHFGSVSVGQTETRTFTITNTGPGVLNLTGPFVQITGRNAAWYSIIQMPEASLNSGQSTTFTVQFNPSGNGLRRAVVEILSDDADEGVFNFDIVGRSQLT